MENIVEQNNPQEHQTANKMEQNKTKSNQTASI